jgi:GT2 family glycosyltransferase
LNRLIPRDLPVNLWQRPAEEKNVGNLAREEPSGRGIRAETQRPSCRGTTARPDAPPEREKLPLSAVICTHDRPDMLPRALESLVRQSPAPGEIIVVDNAPALPTACRKTLEAFPGVIYVFEPTEGLDFARNSALQRATQEILAFLDDDAVAEPGWAGSLAEAFRDNPRIAVCTGCVRPLRLETEGQRLFEANGGFGRGRERMRLPRDFSRRLRGLPAPRIAWAVSLGCGASFAIRREIALRLGGFDEALDLGEYLPGGGDHDMLWRVLEAGYDVVHEPRALALHDHRREKAEACRQIIGHQKALSVLLGKCLRRTHGTRRLGVLLFLGWRLVKPGVRIVRRLFGRDPLPARTLLEMWIGCWEGLTAYRKCVAVARSRQSGGE